MGKRLLVTGAAGFIGSTFVEQRIKSGDSIVVLDKLTYAGHRENLSHVDASKCELVVDDINNGEKVLELLNNHQIDAIVHFAAESHVDNSIASPAAFVETNVNGTYTLLESARQYWKHLDGARKDNFRFIHISTDEVFGSLNERYKFTETTPYRPHSPYSSTKAASDHLARAWFDTYGLPTIVTNCTNNYGPRQHPEKLIPKMITNALKGEKLPVYGNGQNVRDWIHVEDHCRGIGLALDNGVPGETYCFGGHNEFANIDIVKTICDIMDELKPKDESHHSLITFVEDRLGHDFRYAMDDSKSVYELGYTREYVFEEGLRATVEWYLNNAEWCEAVTSNKKEAA